MNQTQALDGLRNDSGLNFSRLERDPPAIFLNVSSRHEGKLIEGRLGKLSPRNGKNNGGKKGNKKIIRVCEERRYVAICRTVEGSVDM